MINANNDRSDYKRRGDTTATANRIILNSKHLSIKLLVRRTTARENYAWARRPRVTSHNTL